MVSFLSRVVSRCGVIRQIRILGLTIQWSHPGRQRRRKVTSKLERLAEAALLDAVLKNDQTLAEVINMFAKIQVHHEDKLDPQFKRIRDKLFREAVDTIISSQRQELERRIDGIVDRLIGTGERSREQQEGEQYPKAISAHRHGMPGATHRHQSRARRPRQTSGSQAFLHDLELIATLIKLASNAMKGKHEYGDGKMYAVEYDGRIIEMDENEYLSYVSRRQEQQTEEGEGYGLDVASGPG